MFMRINLELEGMAEKLTFASLDLIDYDSVEMFFVSVAAINDEWYEELPVLGLNFYVPNPQDQFSSIGYNLSTGQKHEEMLNYY